MEYKSESFDAPDFVLYQDDNRKDLRSASIPRKREAIESQKYFDFRCVKRGDINQASCFVPDMSAKTPLLRLKPALGKEIIQNAEVKVWTKKDMFNERMNDILPLNVPHHHGRCRACHPNQQCDNRMARQAEIRATLRHSVNIVEESD